jgi:hypothetical protein
MQVGARRIEAFLDAQGLAALELGRELALDEQLVGAALEDGDLVVDIDGHRMTAEGARWRCRIRTASSAVRFKPHVR